MVVLRTGNQRLKLSVSVEELARVWSFVALIYPYC